MLTLLRHRLLAPLVLLALALAVAAAGAAGWKRPKPTAVAAPAGLVAVKVRGFRHSFLRPEAELATPRAVCVATGEMTLAPDWPRTAYGKTLQPRDLWELQQDFNRVVRAEFEKAFHDQGGYRLASAPQPCELNVVVSVQDLYLNAPDPMAAGANRTYARSVGHMRLKIDVLDSSGGVLLAQAHAFRVDPENSFGIYPDDLLDESNRITTLDNLDFARDTARMFAEFTRTRLLKARA